MKREKRPGRIDDPKAIKALIKRRMLQKITSTTIRRAREKAGMTQGDLARHLGVESRTVGYWEQGRPPKNGSSVKALLKFIEGG